MNCSLKKFLITFFSILSILILVFIDILLLPPPAIEFAQRPETAVSQPQPQTLCKETQDNSSPPCNPALADSVWSISHGGSYAQGSSAFAGPISSADANAQHLDFGGMPITLNFTTPYADGGTAVWGSPLSVDGLIVKIDHDSFKIIDLYKPAEREDNPPAQTLSISGAYSLIDSDNRFVVGRQRAIEIYGDATAGDRFSPIKLIHRFDLPDDFFCTDDDFIVGLNMTYDDHLAIVTERGMVAILPRQLEKVTDKDLRQYAINEPNCAAQTDNLEMVSNSLAVDETGGIFIVTSQHMIRLDWDGQTLSEAWRTPYEADSGEVSTIRLGAGSGSTPSLMGTGNDDQFVVITDGQPLMHLVLFWRDEIPANWEPIAPSKDRRIACEIPVTFGDPGASSSLSEQSVLVTGYAAIIVNNQLRQEPPNWPNLPPFVNSALAAAAGGNPEATPIGIERIDWNPATRTCATVWVNTETSIPNGIPTMSRATNLFYGIGLRAGAWGLEAVDFETGASRFFIPAAQKRCSLAALQQFEPFVLRLLTAVRQPFAGHNCENSFYAATEIGPEGTIYTGTFLGASKYAPEG